MTLVIMIAFYFVPSLVARMRGHHQTLAIFLTNLFLGWTLIGWVAALIWSATAIPQPLAMRPITLLRPVVVLVFACGAFYLFGRLP